MGRGADNRPFSARLALRRTPFEDPRALSESQQLRIAVRAIAARSANDPRRLEPVQQLCADAIWQRRGGPECGTEMAIEGAYGSSIWDVASGQRREPLVLISAKAMTSSRANNLNNRMTEMVGEAVSLRALHPDATLGFLCLLGTDHPARLDGRSDVSTAQRLAAMIGQRCGDVGPLHLFDAGCLLSVSFERGTCRAIRGPGLSSFSMFLDELVSLGLARVHARERDEASAR